MFRKRQKGEAEIPTSSMADITFLLLLFFLVTTTIDVDTGIGIVLPPPPDETQIVKISTENLLKILVNASGEVLLDDELTSVSQIHEIVKNKIKANEKLIISVKVDRETPYRVYISTLDGVKLAYQDLREDYALQTYGIPSKQLSKEQMQAVREKIPQRISIAEPEQTR
ncbi:MAG TPA: biopolymer transporter ExbD [Bacteroidota bacterium]